MWKDINGKTGYRNMVGNDKTYGNIKLLSVEEKKAALADGIEEYVVPVQVIAKEKLADVKARHKKQLNEWKELLEKSGFEFQGVMYQSDINSVQRMQVAVLSAQSALMVDEPFSINWATADNSEVTLEAADMVDLMDEYLSYSQDLHQQAKELKADVDEAESIDDILGYLDADEEWHEGIVWQEARDELNLSIDET